MVCCACFEDPSASPRFRTFLTDCKVRLGLTGTAIQNRDDEFWCILDCESPRLDLFSSLELTLRCFFQGAAPMRWETFSSGRTTSRNLSDGYVSSLPSLPEDLMLTATRSQLQAQSHDASPAEVFEGRIRAKQLVKFILPRFFLRR